MIIVQSLLHVIGNVVVYGLMTVVCLMFVTLLVTLCTLSDR